MTTIYEKVTDPYERKARQIPGLLVVLPLLVPLVCEYGEGHPILAGVVGLLGGCGAMYAMASVVRGRGKKLEEKLVKMWGGIPTTIALRHRDTFLDSVSKRRYHAAIETKLSMNLPSAQEELENPEYADDIYIGAIKLLRELTRPTKQLLLKENIAYGFHRNMLAMKPVGIFSSLLGIVYGLIIAKTLQITPPHFVLTNLANPGLAASMTLLISIALLTAWVLYFDQSAVKRIGFVYAERLLECLTPLPSSGS